VATDPGTRYLGDNQDATCAQSYEVDSALVHLWGVFGGHALAGELASETAADSMRQFLTDYFSGPEFRGMDEEIVRRMFAVAHEDILATYEELPDVFKFASEGWRKLTREDRQWYIKSGLVSDESMQPIEFGTSAVCVLKWANVLIIAHTGNSKCVVGQTYSDRRLGTIEMTIDHDLNSQVEVERLSQCPLPPTITEGGVSIAITDEVSVSLSVTRALGHKVFAQHGIIPDPEIYVHQLGPDDSFIVLASDGLWESMSPPQAIGLVSTCHDPQTAADLLLREAKAKAPDPANQDNCTAIVVFLK